MFAFGRTALLAGICLLLSDICVVVVRSVHCLQKCFVLRRCVSWCWKGSVFLAGISLAGVCRCRPWCMLLLASLCVVGLNV